MLNSWPNLYKRTVQEIKEIFDKNELMLFIDVHNAYAITAHYVGQGVYGQALDSIDLDGSDDKWGIDKDPFLKKIKSCSAFQLAVIEFWATGFWQAATADIEKIDEYVS